MAMKGIIFSEMARWVDTAFSPAIADSMITRSGVPNDGAYTSVGNYPHEEAISLMVALSELTGRTVGSLARDYGYWLAGRFAVLYPEMIAGYPDARSLLAGVGPHIHEEVTKLYPEATPPALAATISPDAMRLDYASHRPFADIAHGLVEGFVAHFGEDLDVSRIDPGTDGTRATFMVRTTA